MAIKIYKENNLNVFEDTVTSIIKKYPLSDIWYKTDDSESPKKYSIFIGYNKAFQIIDKEYRDFEDITGAAFSSESAFEEFLDDFLEVPVSTDYHGDVAMSRYVNRSTVNKFAYNLDVDQTEVLISSWDGVFDPATDIIETAQTFDITYNSGTEGSGGNGAKVLLIQYLDENFELQEATHVLGGTGSDTTSFSGLGINRAVCVAFGSDISNQNDIDFKATTDGTDQAQIPANNNVTQQAIYHTPINHNFLWSQFLFNSTKLSGGGQPEVTIKGYSYSRVTQGVYEVFRLDFDTQRGNAVIHTFQEPFVIGGREVMFFTALSDTNNSVVNFRFSGILEKII